ncbi:MAG: hypothetical protein K6A72_02425 [Lachnospiraceae bacterium]|nr:hypothetical protein [Lachnospiraceae bacterium]
MLAGKGAFDEAETGFARFCKDHRTITIIDELQECILDNKERLAKNVIFRFANNLFLQSSDTECVKIGMSILGLFDIHDNGKLQSAIKTTAFPDLLGGAEQDGSEQGPYVAYKGSVL